MYGVAYYCLPYWLEDSVKLKVNMQTMCYVSCEVVFDDVVLSMCSSIRELGYYPLRYWLAS